MNPLVVRPLKALCLSSAVALAACTVGATLSPRFVDTIEAVGTDTELPLERIAIGGAFVAVESHATHASARLPARLPAWNATDHPAAPRRAHVGKRLDHADRERGYRHAIGDAKCWT
ncbi:hypothetical protein [Burkholderia ubonensis]|uniref:hypothetical protein n=1 Tax=Burkholderia ubonensis TaxID=101571 RepID=UPI0007570A44|nr:hypothetical protein [Burkholderia ubonensis]KVL69827.1 hypothetical protein WJ48_10225 [Burkholderia ubonensis]KVL70000.1 hypothetical protein WJ49_24140 [Burkholderia ubonensis]KVL85179.1 hypothetical protein WJ50_20605 [Burkholderia ubonensis]